MSLQGMGHSEGLQPNTQQREKKSEYMLYAVKIPLHESTMLIGASALTPQNTAKPVKHAEKQLLLHSQPLQVHTDMRMMRMMVDVHTGNSH